MKHKRLNIKSQVIRVLGVTELSILRGGAAGIPTKEGPACWPDPDPKAIPISHNPQQCPSPDPPK